MGRWPSLYHEWYGEGLFCGIGNRYHQESIVKTTVTLGDISGVRSDVLVTAINSSGLWMGGIDAVINRSAGEMFHAQAGAAMPLTDGQTIVARKTAPHQGSFENVVFVIDDLRRPLNQIVFAGLKAAADAGFKTVSLPTIRLGVMLGIVEKSKAEAVGQMIEGVQRAQQEFGDRLESVTFVVYNDREVENLLNASLAKR